MNEHLLDKITAKKWFDQVGLCIHDFGRHEFSLREFMSAYETVLKKSRLKNHEDDIEPTVRRVLQELRNAEVIEFVDNNGNYRCTEFIDEDVVTNLEFSDFKLTLKPKPNEPVKELVWREGQQAFNSPQNQLHKEKIGLAGEMAVIETEIATLKEAGRVDLAGQVEHVAKTRGDNAGFDILSFDRDANEKWIEVKTTTGHANRRFHISENQLMTSEMQPRKYWLYRLYHFQTGSRTASYYHIHGGLRSQLDLRATEYSALPTSL